MTNTLLARIAAAAPQSHDALQRCATALPPAVQSHSEELLSLIARATAAASTTDTNTSSNSTSNSNSSSNANSSNRGSAQPAATAQVQTPVSHRLQPVQAQFSRAQLVKRQLRCPLPLVLPLVPVQPRHWGCLTVCEGQCLSRRTCGSSM
jgi:ribonuclease D